jgi:hypothetical protein
MNAPVWFSVFCAAAEAVAEARRSSIPDTMAQVNRNVLARDIFMLRGTKAATLATQIFDSLMAGARGET